MTDWNAVSAFMAAVVPWPGSPEEPGYVNLQNSYVDRATTDGKKNGKYPISAGKPFRDVGALVSRAAWINGTSYFKDVWYCLSLQSTAKQDPHNASKLKAVRATANALKLKAIWVDVDVKAGGYETIEDALKALITFREKVGLPPFSALVGSGNGVHAYWISDVALTPAEWAPYAHGLKALLLQEGVKCDAGLTTDAARILRMPGTFNHKTTPPRPVQLFNVPLVLYNFPTALAFLATVAPVTGGVTSATKAPHNIFADGVDPSWVKAGPAFKIEGEPGLEAGIQKFDEILLPISQIFKECGFYSHALKTGGADYGNELWMLSVLGTTFMENGNAVAHAISKGHATYSEADTQALYDRKMAERAERGIGYPGCAAIAGAGCAACQTCPLFSKGKSPLNIRPPVTATVTAQRQAIASQTQAARDMNLPAGFDLNPEGFICKVIEIEQDGELMPPTYLQLFQSKLTDPWVQADPDSLNFTTTVDKGTVFQASINHEMMVSMDFKRHLARNKVKTYPENNRYLEHFFVSWLARLHEAAAAQQALPFGWYREHGAIRGFVFAGRLMRDDNTETPCGVGDAKLRNVFHPTGDITCWYEACKLITQQKRPELDAIIAVSFAAPLTALIGKSAMCLSAWGASGAGKSAAYSVGVSVWGHSKKGKNVSNSTYNSIMKQMGELTNLPLYWDEIKDEKAQIATYDFIFNATDGVEKARLKSDTSMQDRGVWQTQMCIASNKSYVDFLARKDSGHVGGVSRVLEYHVDKSPPDAVGRISQTDAEVVIDKLQTNYGQLGLVYAKHLALNHGPVSKRTIMACKQAEQDLGPRQEERFWVAQIGTLIVGAELANELGADLDVAALKAFLYKTFFDNRRKVEAMFMPAGGAEGRDNTENIMSGYFAKAQTNDQVLWTKGFPTGSGRPAPSVVLHGPKDVKNVSVTTAVAVRWDVTGRKLYVLREHLMDYLAEMNVGMSSVLSTLESAYGMKLQRKVRIAGGTHFDSGRATAYVFNVTAGHDWEDLLLKYSPELRTTKPVEEETVVETGLTPVEDVVNFVKGAVRA